MACRRTAKIAWEAQLPFAYRYPPQQQPHIVSYYSKKRNLSYVTKAGKQFTVHCAYKSSLDGYSKKLFDPFCRTEKIEFQGLQTTVAQLNFLRWCIKNDIIEKCQMETN
jgi:hypothetical protein